MSALHDLHMARPAHPPPREKRAPSAVPMRSCCRCISLADNEIILDAAHFLRLLPYAIEAIFFPIDSVSKQSARDVHRAFLRAYDLDLLHVPLLSYDIRRGVRAPFQLEK